jgi:hypothetical protein
MEENRNRRVTFAFLMGLLGIALIGAIWAWTTRETCGSCSSLRDMTGKTTLAPFGAAYYAVLVLSGAIFGQSRFLFGGVILAAAAHLALLLLLIQRGVFCAPCVVTGMAAIGAAGLCFVVDPSNMAGAGILMPMGAIGAHLAIFLAGGVHVPALAGPEPAFAQVEPGRVHPPEAGKVRMTVFSRAGCPYCTELEEKIIPQLRRDFGDRLDVHREEAPGGIPTPTIVIAGARGTVFPGLPPTDELKAALWSALGGEQHESAVLSQSR